MEDPETNLQTASRHPQSTSSDKPIESRQSEDLETRGGGLWSLVIEVARDCHEHRISAESASIAYYFFLSFFPLLLTMFAITGLIGSEAAFDWIMRELLTALPPAAAAAIDEAANQILRSSSAGALSIGLLLSFWIASNVFAALADGLNQAYRAGRRHKWWQRRALALGLLLLLALALVAFSFLLIAGPAIERALDINVFEGRVQWPMTFFLSISMMWMVYYLLPNHDQSRSKRWILFGAVTGTGLWVLETIVFRIFLSYSSRFSSVYGIVGGIAAFLIWLYLTAMSILIGGEVAAALERRSHSAKTG